MRTAFFWCHLVLGVVAGVPIFTMCVTGSLLALQPQVLEWAEAGQRRVVVPADITRRAPSELIASATRDVAGADAVSLLLSRDPHEAALVTVGRGQVRFVDPYTGAVLGAGAERLRRMFQTLTEFHRWFAVSGENRAVARGVTGWSTTAFVLLAVTGAILWVPRKRSWPLFLRGLVPAWPSSRAARHFNWHTVVGIWCAPVLFVLALTGVVIAFPWATRVLYSVAGTPAPASGRAEQPARDRSGSGQRAADVSSTADYRRVDEAWARAEQQLPTWSSISLRIQGRTNGPLSFTITDATHWNRFARSQLVVSAVNGSVMRWEPYSDFSRGQRWRGWARFAHTGELGGVVGQLVAGLACAGAALLVYTGLSLAVNRAMRALTRAPRDRARAA